MGLINVKAGKRNKQAGFITIEVMFVIIVFVVMTTIGTQQLSRHMDSQNYQIAAQQQQAVADAAGKYLKDYFSTVVGSATPTVPVQITVEMLRNTNYLPIGFNDTNAFGQTLLVLARSPAPNQLESIVLTIGGETIDEIGTREIAENLGGTGGFIPVNNPSIVQGVRGGWQIDLSNYGNPGVGHTASALFLQDGTLTNDYLYRNAVPGHPEVNAMNTSINLNGNDLNAVKTTNTASLNAGTTNTTGETTTGGWFRTKGDSGWLNEKWSGGWYMNDPGWLRSFGDKGVTTGGEMRAGKLTSTGRTQVGEYLQLDGVAVEGAACTPNGLIGRDAAGLTLSCQSGIWKGSAGKDRWGGSFFTASWAAGGCASPNPYTGGCGCPAGYKTNTQFAIAIGGCNPCSAYSCYKPD